MIPSPKRDHQVPDDFIAMAAGVTDLQPMLPLVIEKDCEYVMRNDPLDVVGNRGQKAIEVESFRGNRSNFEQESRGVRSAP